MGMLGSQPATFAALLLRVPSTNVSRTTRSRDEFVYRAAAPVPKNRNAPMSPRGDSPMMNKAWWRYVGMGYQPPQQPVVGKNAKVQWWERLRAIVILAIIVGLLGVLAAGLVGAMVFLAGYLLETAVA